jgi:3-hexulose-6-phosphate synthase
VSRKYKLQIAIDLVDEEPALQISSLVSQACKQGLIPGERIIIEAGTPLIKMLGLRFLPKLKLASGNLPVLADLKTADVGELEASLAYRNGADIASVLARAPLATVKSFLKTSLEYGKQAGVDFIGVPLQELRREIEKTLKVAKEINFPENNLILYLHRGIDEETANINFFQELVSIVKTVRETYPDVQIAIAGGLTPQTMKQVSVLDPDIYVVGRYITQSPSIEKVKEFF